MNDRVLPHNDKIELEVLSTFAISGEFDFVFQHAKDLSPECFYNARYRKVFEIIGEFLKDGVAPDLLTLIGRTEHLIDAAAWTTGYIPFQIPNAINELRTLALKRKLIAIASDLSNAAYDPERDSKELLEKSSSGINEIVSGWRDKKEFTTIETLRDAVSRVEEANKIDQSAVKVRYATDFIDSVLSLYRKQIHTIAGMQGTGKTAFALTAAKHQILEDMRIVYFCTESTRQEIMQRLLASKMSYPIQALLDGLKGDNDGIRLLGSTAEKFKKHKDSFWIYGLGDFELNIDDIALICRKISREHGQIDMIYLDFLQDLEAPPHDRKMDERKAIEYNIKGFKKICSDNNCAGTVLSQFNRETHNQKRPTKKSFRGSGAIDDVSHVMSVLYREGSETEKPSDAPIETWWYSVKTRLIRPWNRKIGFIGKTCTYCGIESHRYGETDRPDQRLPYKD